MPPVPVARPPESQTRMVLGVIAGLVVVGLILALIALRPVFSANPLTPETTPSRIAADPGIPSANASPSAAVNSRPITIAAAKALDPQGDNSENNAAASRVIDGNAKTEWRSERYGSANFGGLNKTGVGLLLDLGKQSSVSQVVIDQSGTGGRMELRTATAPRFEGSTVLDKVPVSSNRLTLTLEQPVTTRYLVLWFTTLTRQSTGEYRLRVFEVSVR